MPTKTIHDNIKELVENNNYVIVLDTNVYMNLYRYSPDLVEFLFQCLEHIKSYIAVPKTVYVEIIRNHKSLFAQRQKSIEESVESSVNLISQQKIKTLKSCCSVLERGGFPETESLIEQMKAKYEELEGLLHSYFDDHKVLSLIKDSWTGDMPFDFIEKLACAGQIMRGFTMLELYSICDEGEKRYGKKTPPGYMDDKQKEGIRKYSDLIWWKEVIRFAKEEKKNIILVTDDIKEDWWLTEGAIHKFREELIDEFNNGTINRDKNGGEERFSIKPFLSRNFFDQVAESYNLERPDAIDIAMSLTDDDYINSIQDKVFNKIMDKLCYLDDDFLDMESMSHIGSEGIDEWEVEDYAYQRYEVIGRDGNTVNYNITYEVELFGISYDYWGRDDETKEIYLSPEIQHTVRGHIEVQVERTVDMMLDFSEDSAFERCKIVRGKFEEIGYKDTLEDDYWNVEYE